MKTVLVVKILGEIPEVKQHIRLLEEHYYIISQSRFRVNKNDPNGGVHVFVDLGPLRNPRNYNFDYEAEQGGSNNGK